MPHERGCHHRLALQREISDRNGRQLWLMRARPWDFKPGQYDPSTVDSAFFCGLMDLNYRRNQC